MFTPDLFKVPENASNVVLVENLPVDATTREVAHIFRPYLGYKRIRMEVKQVVEGASSVAGILVPHRALVCYAEFETQEQATTVINTI